MFNFAVKELLKRKKLYLLSVITVALVTALIIILNSLGTAYKDASKLPFQSVQGTIVIQKNGNVPEDVSGVLLSCSLAPINLGVVNEISQFQGVKNISSSLALWVFDSDYFKRVLGVNWDDSFGKNLKAKVIEGSIPSNNQEVLIEKTYAQQHSLKVGQEVGTGGHSFKISGIIQTAGNEIVASDIYLNMAIAQQMAYQSKNLQAIEPFDKTDVNIIFVDADQTNMANVTNQIKTTMNSGGAVAGQTPLGQTIGDYNIYTPESFDSQISSLFKVSDKLTWIISLIIFIGGALIITRSVLHSIVERRKEFGIMKSVGFRSWDVQKEIFAETILQISVGFVAGLIISAIAILGLAHTTVSIAIPWELTAYPHFLMANPQDANVVQTHFLPIRLEPLYVLAAFGTTVIIGILTAFISTWQVNRVKPMEVMKYE
jgi:putative ABC transport system permease protein